MPAFFVVAYAGVLVVVAAALVGVLYSPFRPVTRVRLERFALRQSLVITLGNGPLVLNYLATTRRWRGSGLLLVALGAVAYGVGFDPVHVNFEFAWLFVGWFAGAVIAEWRVAAPEAGARRIASLHRRALGDYLLRRELVVPAVVWAGLALTSIVGAVVRLADHSAASVSLLAEFGVLVFVAGGFGLVSRRVLQRPQPLIEADMLDADEALRSRSLHVLAGSSLAVGGYFATLIVGTLVTSPDSAIVGVAGAVGLLFLPILGVITALAPAQPGRRHLADVVA